jgi:hypothetical protein
MALNKWKGECVVGNLLEMGGKYAFKGGNFFNLKATCLLRTIAT